MLTILLSIVKSSDAPPADAPAPAEGETGGEGGDAKPEGEGGNAAEGGDAAEGGEKKPVEMVGKCLKPLLESFDIQSSWETVEDQNVICPSVTKLNCCSYHAQLDIFRKWVLKGEKKKIIKTYR